MSFFKHHPMVFGNRYMRCLVTFGIMEFLMAVILIINSYLVLNGFDEAAALTATALEILWDYFPMIVLFIFMTEVWPAQSEIARLEIEEDHPIPELTEVQKRFLRWNLLSLAALIPVTILKIYWRFNCPECFEFWRAALTLEWLWIYLQAVGPALYVKDKWGRATAEERWHSVFFYLMPVGLLIISAIAFRVVEQIFPGSFSLRLLSCVEDFFFVLAQMLSTFGWIAKERMIQRYDDHLDEVMEERHQKEIVLSRLHDLSEQEKCTESEMR